ncbi:MFS transporter [Duganella sp. FT92W]|uniref:MFS transporter n=1 Tax=Pseudoduganella rivuli TaxID=2666085 RepID=A0A7X2IL54_9BURK|nr:MFS transporter [Pseudoduganella rivuli]MRV72042.1 MFS transporter [Pseudoduganella rivuli]
MRKINVSELAGAAPFSAAFHGKLLIWCGLVIIFDGYDLAVAGIALPSIMATMGVNAASAGFMVSSALFGMMVGAIGFGTAADRIGRPKAIAISMGLFSLFTLATGFTSDPVTFSAVRFLAGLGIGGVLPNLVAEMAEFSPARIRTTLTTFMFSGYAVGGMLAAVTGKSLLDAYGWQSVFFVAGMPVVLVPFVLKSLPESMPFLIRNQRTGELKRVLAAMAPSHVPQVGDTYVTSAGTARCEGVRALFAQGRGFSTVMLWTVFFMCLFMVYALSAWLAKLMASAGYSLGSALNFVLALNFGAMVGAIGGGWLADRINIKYVLMTFFLLASASIGLLGYDSPLPVRFLLVGLAGATTIGTQLLAYAYVSQFYPLTVGGTGLGWASGVGRTGAIIAPVLIGTIVGMQLELQHNFFAIAVPGLLAFIAMALVDHRFHGQEAPADAEPLHALPAEAVPLAAAGGSR